jgi:PKD repeat protein
VIVGNDPPIAKCKTGPLVVAVSETFDVNDGSYDSENDPIIYKQTATLYSVVGIYTANLTVTDNYGRSSSYSTSVIVNDPPVARCKKTVVAPVNRTFSIDGGS